MLSKLQLSSLIFGLTILIYACGKEGDTGPQGPEGPQGPQGQKSVINVQQVPPGATCVYGGVLIKSGIDKNGNNKLDEDEVDAQQAVCNGTPGLYDKQVLFQLGAFSTSNNQGKPETWATKLVLPFFNIGNYQGIDSVVLIANPNGYGVYPTQPGMPGIDGPLKDDLRLELYNFTDNVVIPNSEILTRQGKTQPLYLRSRNFAAEFPKKEIDLGLKMSTVSNLENGTASQVFLILYRK